MIDLGSEEVITLTEAAKRLPSLRAGSRPHICTMYRWAQRGIRGVRLETARLGGTTVTSIEAIQRFSERCSGTDPKSVPSKASERSIERKQRECEALGV